MTLKKFIDLIGGMTDRNMDVHIKKGMNESDDGSLKNIRSRLENKYYAQEFDGWYVSFFNIVDNALFINMARSRKEKA